MSSIRAELEEEVCLPFVSEKHLIHCFIGIGKSSDPWSFLYSQIAHEVKCLKPT